MDNVGHLKTMKDFGQFSKADRKEFAKNWKDMRDAWSEKSKAGSTTDQPAKVKATEVLKTTVAAASQEVSKLTDKQVLSDPKTSLADLGENLSQTVEKAVKVADAAIDHAKDRVEEVTDKVRNSVSQALGRVGGLIIDTGEIKAGVTEEDAREGSVNAVSYAPRLPPSPRAWRCRFSKTLATIPLHRWSRCRKAAPMSTPNRPITRALAMNARRWSVPYEF